MSFKDFLNEDVSFLSKSKLKNSDSIKENNKDLNVGDFFIDESGKQTKYKIVFKDNYTISAAISQGLSYDVHDYDLMGEELRKLHISKGIVQNIAKFLK